VSDSEWDDTPVLITEAALSNDDQQAARKRRYVLTMGMRVPCLILAVVFMQTWWLMVFFVLISIPLPWVAVLMANDRAPRKAERVSHFRGQRHVRALEHREHPVIDG
jgi:uncharacterized membrane protein